MTNQASPLSTEAILIAYNLASFIGWQVAISDYVTRSKNTQEGFQIVREAQANVKKLMLGESLPLGTVNSVSLTNKIGEELVADLAASIEDITSTMKEENDRNATTD